MRLDLAGSSSPVLRSLDRWMPFAPTVLLGAAALGLPEVGRGVASISIALTAFAVLAGARRSAGGTARGLTALLIGLLPAVILLGVVHDLPGVALPLTLSRLLLLVLWLTTSMTLGTEATRRIVGRRALADVWVRILAAAAVTAYFAGALIRLLLPSRGPSARLAWILSEEDNAHVVGVLREVLVDGPRGVELAEQYGTAFANIPLLILRLLGGPVASDGDVRLQAVTGFTVSAIVAIALAGLALALLVALPRHIHRDPTATGRRIGAFEMALGGIYSGAAVLAASSLLIVLPMRTGFITFVWGLTVVLVSSALVVLTPSQASPGARLVLVASLLGAAAILLSSWPFILTALLPALALPLTWIRWSGLVELTRQHRGRVAAGLAIGLVLLLLGATWLLHWGPAAEVLSYGRDILLAQASGISADTNVARLSAIVLVAAVTMALLSMAAPGRTAMVLALAGPPIGAGSLYLGLEIAAAILTDGELNYSGIKLLYAVIVLAATLGLVGVAALANDSGRTGILVAGILIALVHWTSPTVNLHTEWWERTDLDGLPHASAVVVAVSNSSADLPIRCLPASGTAVTPVTRWASYFCARWMEDAFNEGRFGGGRGQLLNADDATFDDIIDRLRAEHPSEYTFAYQMQMGLGWFGWDGRN